MTGDVSSGVAAWPRTEEAAQHDAGINRTLFSARIVNPSLSVHKTGKIWVDEDWKLAIDVMHYQGMVYLSVVDRGLVWMAL